jgi:hypothetical protein
MAIEGCWFDIWLRWCVLLRIKSCVFRFIPDYVGVFCCVSKVACSQSELSRFMSLCIIKYGRLVRHLTQLVIFDSFDAESCISR